METVGTNRTLGHNLRSGQDVIGKSEDFRDLMTLAYRERYLR